MKKKIIIFMLFIGILAITIVTFIMAILNNGLIIASALDENENISKAISVTLDNYLNETIITAKTLASSPLIKEALIKRNNYLEELNNDERNILINDLNNKWIDTDNINDEFIQNYISNPVALHLIKQQEIIPNYYGEIFLTNKYGELIASTGKLSTLAHAQKYWWLASYNEGLGRVFLDDRGYDISVDGYVLGVVVPIYDTNKNVIGILKSNINIIDMLEMIIKEYEEVLDSGTIKIARTNGLVVFELGQTPLSSILDESYLPNIKNDNFSAMIKNSNKKNILINIFPIHNTQGSDEIGFGGSYESIDHIQGNTGENWVVVIAQSKDYINKVIFSYTMQFIYIGIILMAIMIIAILFFVKRITRPIEELVVITTKLDKGNLDKEINIDAKDEIKDLVNSFNEMVRRINSTMASRNELINEINKRKKVEKENLAMEENLRNQQKLESIGTLASGVAHEINNPINGVLNYGQLILDAKLDNDEVNEFAKEIIIESERIAKIVTYLLKFSRQENQIYGDINFEDIISNTLSLINKVFKNDQIEINLNIDKNIPEVQCNSQQIQQVLMSLFTNARDALNKRYPEYDKNKIINIYCSEFKKKEEKWIKLTVEDFGIGIEEKIKNEIFDPFFTTKDKDKGTGLGLSISYGIVKEHHGDIIVESEENKYTRFIMTLPCNNR